MGPNLMYCIMLKTQSSVTRMVHRLQDLENLQSSSLPRTPICVAKQVTSDFFKISKKQINYFRRLQIKNLKVIIPLHFLTFSHYFAYFNVFKRKKTRKFQCIFSSYCCMYMLFYIENLKTLE